MDNPLLPLFYESADPVEFFDLATSDWVALAAGVTANTVTRIENGGDAKQSTVAAMQKALQDAGATVLPDAAKATG